MKEIDFEKFTNLLRQDGKINNYIINLNEDDYLLFDNIFNREIQITNCNFNNQSLKILGQYDETQNEELSKELIFQNCSFKGLSIKNCGILKLNIENININCGDLEIEGCFLDKLNVFSLENFSNKIFIKNSHILKKAIFSGINFAENGTLSIFESHFKNSTNFIESRFNNVDFTLSTFYGNFDFHKNRVLNNFNGYYFNDCVFEKANFSRTTFSSTNEFTNCIFLKSTLFNEIGDYIKSSIRFENCSFEKLADFSYSSIYKIEIIEGVFEGMASFQNTKFDIAVIDKSTFGKGAFFDDIQIKKIDDCERRTIRTIKQELQKAENRIDFNRFRVYEFNAYRKDIRKKLAEFKKDKNHFYHRRREPIQLKRDLFILNLSDIASEYGTDWKRAIKFTLIFGFVAFTLFFILENLDKSFKLSNWEDFVYGYFRFFLITDFKNEYYKTGESVLKFNCFVSLLPFIIGKIAVAFGIYVMIQSFRKFKA